MLRAQRTMDARERDVETLGFEARVGSCAGRALLCSIDDLLDLNLELVDACADVALGRTGSSLQPKIVDLGEHAVLPSHPAIAKFLPGIFRDDRIGFLADCGEQLTNRAIKRSRRIIVEFGNAVSQSKFSARYLNHKGHEGTQR